MKVGEFIVQRLAQLGAKQVFGVPGDFVISFCKLIEDSGAVEWVGCSNELNAAYAADGYARIRGLGVVVTTFGVGEFSATNGLAGALAEHVPVLEIVGIPESRARKAHVPLHHLAGSAEKHGYDVPRKVAKRLVVAHALLDNPATAPAKIDHVLRAMLRKSGPGYLAIPQEMVHAECAPPTGSVLAKPRTVDAAALAEAVSEASGLLNAARNPLIVVDGGVARTAELRAEALAFVEASGIPFVATPLAKGAINETHPQFVGVFSGKHSLVAVRQAAEEADVVIYLGPVNSDINWGGLTGTVGENAICADTDHVKIRSHSFAKAPLEVFIPELRGRIQKRQPSTRARRASEVAVHVPSKPFKPVPEAALTSSRFFDRIAHMLPPNAIVLADTGVASFAATETAMPPGSSFLCQTNYASIGWAVGAAFGASIADPLRDTVLIVGDGALQMTVQELSSMVRMRSKVTVFVLNNDGYSIERAILEGRFNNIQQWRYASLLETFGGCPGQKVSTEGELEGALERLAQHAGLGSGPQIVEVCLAQNDVPPALQSAAQKMRK